MGKEAINPFPSRGKRHVLQVSYDLSSWVTTMGCEYWFGLKAILLLFETGCSNWEVLVATNFSENPSENFFDRENGGADKESIENCDSLFHRLRGGSAGQERGGKNEERFSLVRAVRIRGYRRGRHEGTGRNAKGLFLSETTRIPERKNRRSLKRLPAFEILKSQNVSDSQLNEAFEL